MRQATGVVTTLCVAAFLVGMTSGCKSGNSQTKEPIIQNVRIAAAESCGNTRTVSYPGRVQAAQDVNLSFRVAGPIAAIHFNEGQHVSKGDTLAEIEERDYALQLAATTAQYEQVKAEAERVIELADRGSAAQNDYDKARYGLEQVTALYHAHQNSLNDTKMTAPFDGWVQQVLFQAGETVGAGMPVISLISDGAPIVKVEVPAEDFANIDAAARYWCTSGTYPGHAFLLRLIDITKKANLNQLFTARFALEPAHDGTMPQPGTGVSVSIEYPTGQAGHVKVPATAMFSHQGQDCVWVINPENKVSRRAVTVTDMDRDGMITVSAGLRAGEHVVTAGVNSLKDGEQVRILPEASSSNVGNLL